MIVISDASRQGKIESMTSIVYTEREKETGEGGGGGGRKTEYDCDIGCIKRREDREHDKLCVL